MDDKNYNEEHVCGDNCDHDHDEELPTVTLTLEDDTQLECAVLGTFDVEDNEYIAVVPLDSDEALIYKFIQHEDDEIELTSIESDEEFEKASEAFYTFFAEEFEDEDEEEEE